jgi:ATP-dependent protease ClpP protease subunit
LLGRTIVYSAGVTIMAAFPRADRWLSLDTRVMIHRRQLIEGSDITLDELFGKTAYNWYSTAAEAVARGLAAGLYPQGDGHAR